MDISEYYLRRILIGGPVPMSCAARGAVSYSALGLFFYYVLFRFSFVFVSGLLRVSTVVLVGSPNRARSR
jgi:hypothetical protein